MKSVEIRESLKSGADLGSVRICTASRCQLVGGVHMMHQVPSRIMHICNDERFQCQDCERNFSGPSGLWQHKKSKHKGVKYACNQCDQQFTLQRSLTKHIQHSVHT